MPKVGKYQYPHFDLDYVENKIEQILETCGNRVSRDVLAESLGMTRGGGFSYMVSSFTIYGLAETSGGEIKLNEDAENLVYGEGEVKEKVKQKCATNVRLFREIKKEYGSNPSKKQIKVILRDKGGANPKEAEKKVKRVRKVYLGNAEYVNIAEEPEMPFGEEIGKGIGRREKIMPSEERSLTKIQHEDLYIQLPSDDVEAMKTAKSTLEFFIKRQENRREEE